jgi:hypothetical protein
MAIWSLSLVYGELQPASVVRLLARAIKAVREAPPPRKARSAASSPTAAAAPASDAAAAAAQPPSSPAASAPASDPSPLLGSGFRFVDLGSGEGVPVLIGAAMLGFAEARGIELVPRLHRAAVRHLEAARDLARAAEGGLTHGSAEDREIEAMGADALAAFALPRGAASRLGEAAASAAESARESALAPSEAVAAAAAEGSHAAAADTQSASPAAVFGLPLPLVQAGAARLEIANFLETTDWTAADIVFLNGTC